MRRGRVTRARASCRRLGWSRLALSALRPRITTGDGP
jgi:hypothetical protein